jgi:hypothetical protein
MNDDQILASSAPSEPVLSGGVLDLLGDLDTHISLLSESLTEHRRRIVSVLAEERTSGETPDPDVPVSERNLSQLQVRLLSSIKTLEHMRGTLIATTDRVQL